MDDRGLYLLILRLKKHKTLPVGRLGEVFFEAGYYIYVGRAKRGLSARIQRHLRANKKIFWHIDYLLKEAQIVSIVTKPGSFDECGLVKKLLRLFKNSTIPLLGFGASDCRCPGHLIYLPEIQNLKDLISNFSLELSFKSYAWLRKEQKMK
ncbi:MAG: GIY-YIG nuclease family protein [Candidatus Saccharicenans sp.]|nr:MAG: DUF123 domain-containing protein [Candidatus Aminicenantes bacterium]HEK85689.1 GIY-YIG nuclease family protein [Candidatus Aminicenantes bacterium]